MMEKPPKDAAYDLVSAEEAADSNPNSPSTDTFPGGHSARGSDSEEGERVYPTSPLNSDWSAEYSSLVFAVLCLVGLVIFLNQFDGAPFSKYHGGPRVTPNAVVSIFSTFAKGSILAVVASCLAQWKWLYLRKNGARLTDIPAFENASGGPKGAFSFLWGATPWGGLTLEGTILQAMTYLGCVIVISAAATDPFNQQLLFFESLPVNMGMSTVPRSQTFFPPTSVIDWKLTNVNPAAQPIINGAQLGIFSPQRGLDTLSSAPFFCPGANCTFPSFTTLAVCSSCVDVTAQVVSTQNCTYNSSAGGGAGAFTCTSQIPSGFNLTNGAFCYPTRGGWNYDALVTSVNGSSDLPVLAQFALLRFDNADEYRRGNSSLSDSSACVYPPGWLSTLTAYECNLALCAQAFEGWNYYNGTLQPGTVAGYALGNVARDASSYTLVARDEPFADGGGNASSVPPFPASANRTFCVDADVLDQIQISAKSILNMTTTGVDASSIADPNPYSYLLNAFYASVSATSGPAAMLARMAAGMTYALMAGPNATLEEGVLWVHMPFFTVRFWWLTPLVALLVVTGMLLFVTAWYTRRVGQRAWKGSLLPVLYRPGMGRGSSKARDGKTGNEVAMWTRDDRERRAGEIREVVGLR